jgi:hypothetical protein
MVSSQVAGTKPDGAAPPRRRRVPWAPLLSLLGTLVLGYLPGAAVMYFDLPTSGFLTRAFLGARAWNERRQALARASDEDLPPVGAGQVDKPGKTFDGFTLCTFASASARNSQAVLLNMRREVVHRWEVPFSEVWPRPGHIPFRVHDRLVTFFGCHPYPNGDLLVVFHGLENRARGYGLAKLDKDSNVLWKYGKNVHHDVDVAEDGTIYAVRQEILDRAPKGLESLPVPCLADYLVQLSPEGKELRTVPILEAFRDSRYAPLLAAAHDKGGGRVAPGSPADPLHTNFVQVLSRRLAPKFPLFRAGQILISVRTLNAVAVLDVGTGSVVWAATGPWRAQHDAQFLGNGHLLLFDNLGFPKSSRVLEYDPQTQAFPWWYPGGQDPPFRSDERGMCQRLPNGNTLVVNSEGGRLLEVTRRGEVVWSCAFKAFICSGRRYSPGQLPFLKEGPRARP